VELPLIYRGMTKKQRESLVLQALTARGSNQTIIGQEGGLGRSILFRDVNTGKLKSFLGRVNKTSTAAIPTGTWTHVALVKNGGTIQLYINGALDVTTNVTTDSSIGAFHTSTQITSMYNGLTPKHSADLKSGSPNRGSFFLAYYVKLFFLTYQIQFFFA
jgi:hypothetical protein